MRTLLYDLRYAMRMLAKSPGFTAVAVLTLALGIGANTAIFTLVHAILLKSLPVANPNELYRVGDNDNCCVIGSDQGNWGIYSYPLYKQFRDHTPEFSELAAFEGGEVALSARRSGSNAAALPFAGEFVSGNYFTMFGLNAFAGRLIAPTDDAPGAAPVAAMSYHTWQQNFAGDPSVIGASFVVNTKPYTIVGIAPPGFYGDRIRDDPPDFWLPLSTEPALNGQNSILNHLGEHWLYIVGRLQPGARPASVQAETTAELQRWIGTQPDLTPRERAPVGEQHIVLVPAGGGVQIGMQEEAATPLRLLAVITSLVLLIACANIANLLLARGAARRAETAVRVALGAPRRRLIRQVLTESVLLALVGGGAGVYVAYAGARLILVLGFRASKYVPISADPSLPVLVFAFLLSLVTGVVFGVAPAWLTSRSDPMEALHGAGRSTRERGSLLRRSLVVVQVALSTALLIGAGLLVKSLRNLETQRFGFEPQGRLVVRVDPSLAGYTPEKLPALYQQLDNRLSRIPGVLSAAYSQYSPMEGNNWEDSIKVEGRPPDEQIGSSFLRVSPRYFETVGTRLLRGRVIEDHDTATSRAVAVVSQAFVKKYFPNTDPVGKHFGLELPSNVGNYEIVGVVDDAMYQRERIHPVFFLPFFQSPKGEPDYMVRSQYIGSIELRVAGKPENLGDAVRRALADIDPNLTVLNMVSLPEQVAEQFTPDRIIAQLTGLFGALALVLACVGLYGVTAYFVARRTNEIGIRMALGADRRSVLSLVMRGALVQVAIGLAIGIPLALAGGRLMASQLYDVKSYDPLTLALAAVILIACTVVAGFVPARRAASIEPIQALRCE
ncbi:MAG: ABC transporter permease [Terriglobia bacterium]